MACGDDGKAQLRIVHASPDAPNVDVYVDSAKVAENVPYGTASDYLTVKAGKRHVTVTPTGVSTNVINVTADFAKKKDYTVLAVDFVASISALTLEDNTKTPGSGNILLRVVHGSPSAGPVDVYVTAPGDDISPPLQLLATSLLNRRRIIWKFRRALTGFA